jgi:hypothetical protein
MAGSMKTANMKTLRVLEVNVNKTKVTVRGRCGKTAVKLAKYLWN